MSLTSLLDQRHIRQRVAEEFPCPQFVIDKPMVAQPRSNRYSLVGTAFDYLLRFYVKRLNPGAIEREWVAKEVVQSLDPLDDTDWEVLKIARSVVVDAVGNVHNYLTSGRVTRTLLHSCLQLAQLDVIYRAGYVDPNVGVVHEEDVDDLKKLIGAVDPTPFKAQSICVLNPTFGTASRLVGGADADLVVDGTLIDVKTTKRPKLQREQYHQLIGYYALHRLDGVFGYPRRRRITTLGVYFSRYGVLWTVRVRDVIREARFIPFLRWFRRQANLDKEKDICEILDLPVYETSRQGA